MTPTGGVIDVADVRAYLLLNSPSSSSQYSDATIGSNILMAQSMLEKATGRYFVDRTFTTPPWIGTTRNALQVPIPGFRSFTSIVKGGVTLTPDSDVWAIPDAMQTGVYTSLQFRADTGYELAIKMPWVYGASWWDKLYDSPWYPPNMGGGLFFTSMPNDLAIQGSAGYPQASIPYDFLMAVRAQAGWLTQRPASLMADTLITPAGGVLSYSNSPDEVKAFVMRWRGGQPQMVSTG